MERQPARHRNESPIAYYKRTGWVHSLYQRQFNGRFYCNPAHCRRTWKNKKNRDAHLNRAYATLM